MKSIELILGRLALGCWLSLCVGCGSQNADSISTQSATSPASSNSGSESVQTPAKTPGAAPAVASNAATAAQTIDTSKLPKPTDEQIARWRPRTSQPLRLLASREGAALGFVSFLEALPDGDHYLVGGTRLTLLSVGSDKVEHTFIEAMTAEDERLTAFAVAPGGQWCAVGNKSGVLKVFSIAERKEIASVKTGQHSISQLAISTDGKEIATVAYTKDIEIWEAPELKNLRKFSVDTREIKQLKYIGPQLLIAAGESMSSWNTADGSRVATYPAGRYERVSGLSADGKQLLFSNDKGLQRWDLSTNTLVGVYPGNYARNEENRFTTNGSQFASLNGEAIRIWDAESGQLQQVIDVAGNAVTDMSWLPGQSLLLVASDNGRVRFWGTEEAGKPFGMNPLHKAAEWPKASPSEPANVDQLVHTLDLRLLPKLPHATPVDASFNALNYSATVGIDEARLFYRYLLGQQQWKETTDPATPDTLRFVKDGNTALLSIYASSPAETYVSLSYLGNYDIRQTPKLKNLVQKDVYSGDSTVLYTAKASLLEIETELLRNLHQAGWTAVSRLKSRQGEESDGRQMDFVKNGVVLNVFVRPEKDQPGQYSIQYSASLTLHALPIPSDAGLAEWDNYLEPQLVANTSMSLKQATEFYDTAMVKQGWLQQSSGRRIDEEKGYCYLPYMWGQRDVTIGLRRLPDGSVRIRAGKYSGESWQPVEDDEKPVASGKDDQKQDPTGIEAVDVPTPQGSGVIKYDQERPAVTYELKSKTPLKQVAEEFRKAMTDLGWEAKDFGSPIETSLSLMFKKGSQVIYFNSAIDPLGVGRVTIEGEGLRWNKKPVRTTRVSFATWLRENRHPASLKRLDEYKAIMQKLPAAGN
jgi:WD40 repeat protein